MYHLNAKIKKTELDEISVVTNKAEGKKCSVCWKISDKPCIRHFEN